MDAITLYVVRNVRAWEYGTFDNEGKAYALAIALLAADSTLTEVSMVRGEDEIARVQQLS